MKIVTACTAISLTSSAAAYEAIDVTDGGAVRGHVQYVGRPPARAKLEITKNKRACGGAKGKLDESLLVNAGGGIANVVVHLAGISRGAALQPGIPNPTLDQRGCQFRPHVLIFPAGSTLDVLNSDRIEHRIHTYADENPSVHRTQPGFNTQIQLTFEKPELPIRVECDAHPWMSGWLVVQSHPYYAVTDDSGDFTLPNVPAGYYRLETWHEVLGRQMRSLSVPAGGESTVTISYYQQTQYPHLAQLRNRALSAIRTLIPWELPSRPR